MINVFDITEFGAVDDGKTDCSEAVQKAVDSAARVNGCVIVPPGRYLCKNIKMYPHVSVRGFDAWNFRKKNSSMLVLSDGNAKCLLDITGAVGCTVRDLGLDGRNTGKNIHGIMLDHPIYDAAEQEDTPTVENCTVVNFSGSAIYFNHVWCATVRNNMLAYSENGFFHDGWDLFMSGNWLSGNRDCGFKSGKISSAVIFTNNRIEWNANYGVCLHQSKFMNISDNQFDRAGKSQLKIYSTGDGYNRNISVTGNNFCRSGSGEFLEWMKVDGYESSHIYAENCVNLVITSNTFHTGRDGADKDGKRHFGPQYGIVYKHLRSSIIKDNVMQSASTSQNIADLGCHEEDVIVKDNVGGVMESEERWTAMLKDKPVEVIRSYFSLTDEEKAELKKRN